MEHVFSPSQNLPTLDASALNSPQSAPPFVIHIEHLDIKDKAYWRPAAFVKFTPALRESGFLRGIPPEELKNLIFLLTFLTPNGDCWPTLSQIAEAMGVSMGKAHQQMERLVNWQWQGKAVVAAAPHGNGEEAYALARGIIPVTEDSTERLTSAPSPVIAASREEVIAYSRARYNRPRAEVEREIIELNYPDFEDDDDLSDEDDYKDRYDVEPHPPEPPDDIQLPPTTSAQNENASLDTAQRDTARQRKLRRQLARVGLNSEEVQLLTEQFEHGRIRRQLLWLPYRHARNPSAFLLAAIEGNYAPPPLLRRATNTTISLPPPTIIEAESHPPPDEPTDNS